MCLNQAHIVQQYTGHTCHYTSASVLSHSPSLIHPIPWLSLLNQIENHFFGGERGGYERTIQNKSIHACGAYILANLFCELIIPCEGELTTYTT